MKKNIMKVIAAVLTLVVIAKIVGPNVDVFAQGRNIEFDFTDGTINGNDITYTVGNTEVTATLDNSYTLNNGRVTMDDEAWLTAITIDDNYDADTMQIRVYESEVENPFQATYSYSNGTLTRNGEGGLPDSVLKFVIELKATNPLPPEPGEGFDGRAVVLWSCGSGVCYHEFEGDDIGDFHNGTSTFFKDTQIEADNKPGTTFDVNAEYREWYLTDEFNKWQELYELATGNQVNWNTLDPELIMGNPKDGHEMGPLEDAVTEANYCQNNETMEQCVNRYAAEVNHEIWTHELQPVGEPTENNAYVSYGDRNFKVVIYNEDYKGISTTSDFNGLNYYPTNWADPFLRTDQYDVSDTSENHPTLLESILLESTVNIDVLPWNNYEIDTIEALDVPNGAVTITKVNNRKFQLVFSSNFYDHVVFKLTDTNGEESYVQVKRYTIDGYIRYDDERHIPVLAADFYFDREKSHEHFIITAKIVYKDGTIENATLEAIENFRDGLGNPVDGFELDQENPDFEFSGKGLKMSRFEYDLAQDADRNIQDVYLNAEYTGSDEYTYAGAYAGSGEGTPANIYHPEEGE